MGSAERYDAAGSVTQRMYGHKYFETKIVHRKLCHLEA